MNINRNLCFGLVEIVTRHSALRGCDPVIRESESAPDLDLCEFSIGDLDTRQVEIQLPSAHEVTNRSQLPAPRHRPIFDQFSYFRFDPLRLQNQHFALRRATLHRFVGFDRTIQKNFVRGKSF